MITASLFAYQNAKGMRGLTDPGYPSEETDKSVKA